MAAAAERDGGSQACNPAPDDGNVEGHDVVLW